ncbi:lytic transglycosylase domain-containing protein [Pendulispora brunnea]|uniref:Lytic transglycosylase domain-containing protein n=1 Tax=Pendulispora brunnea TaxID=2905690 RepID=A0ABZ2KSI5_9BACT
MRSAVVTLATIAALVPSCARRETAKEGPAAVAAADASTLMVLPRTSDGGTSPPREVPHWAESVRMQAWDDAARELDALPDAEKQEPSIRYVRARVALARGGAAEVNKAIALLDDLKTALPLLADDIERRRAEAKLSVGPFRDAADYYNGRGSAAALLKASEAYEKSQMPVPARAACDRVIALDKHTRAQEAEARARRIRLGVRTPTEDASDARWIVVEAPDLTWAKDAEATLAKSDPAHPLTAEELLKRAKVLGDANMVDEALESLKKIATAPGKAVANIDRLRAKADILMHARTHALEASKAFDECVAVGGPKAADDAFHAARALSRADHDDEAIERYAQVARRFPKTPWAEKASFYGARLHLLHARWAQAAAAFDEYAKNFPKGDEKREALRGRAIARLMNKDYKLARKHFEELAGDENDAIAAARATNLAALAALHDGDRTQAVLRWTDVARSRPLSWPALVARARLAEVKAPLPPAIDPPDPKNAWQPLSISIPPPVDMLFRVGLDADAEAQLRERESLLTSAATGRGVEALCEAYGYLGRAKRRYQVAQQIPAATLAAAPSPATEWAWECAFPRPYDAFVRAEETAHHLPSGLLHAVMRVESAFDPDVTSPARAVGLLQLLPETALTVAKSLGQPNAEVLLTNPAQNIKLGARYLKELIERFHGQIPLALAGYNGGPDAVARWMSRLKDAPLDVFVEQIPYTETRAYVVRVMGNFARYAFLQGGESQVPTVTLTYDKD